MLEVQELERRDTPGSDLLPIWVGMIALQPRAVFRPIDTPKADLVIISASKDGRPSRFLDLAHDLFPKASTDSNVYSLCADIDGKFAKVQRPLTVVIVATETPNGNGVIFGRDYLYYDADPTRAMNVASGKVKSITFLVDNAVPKAKLYQQIASGLASVDTVTLTSYSGMLRIISGPPAQLTANGSPMTWTGVPQGGGK